LTAPSIRGLDGFYQLRGGNWAVIESMEAIAAERPRSLADVVTARLRREIVEGEFELGQALSESKIATRYGVSRTPVREAFACLGLEGLVRTEPQQGTFVFTIDRAQFAQISEARSILETAALRLAIERGEAELVRQWRRLVEGMTVALRDPDARSYSRCDGNFHQALFTLAANPFLIAAGQAFAAKMAAVRNRLGAHPEHMAKSYEQHVELLALVERSDVEAAVALLEHHIRHKGESFWNVPDSTPKSRWERILALSE
jgi:DNA-binding GntR family transcriptional regulator